MSEFPRTGAPVRTVIVVGGAGAFGARLVEGLVATTDLRVVVAGRDLAKAEARARFYPCGRVGAVRLDTRQVTTEDLSRIGADLVADVAGPFQASAPRLARAAIAAGLPYIDLADGRDFVAGFSALDAEARAAGTVVLTGASSTPALSNAALDAISEGWRRVEAVSVAIMPGNRAPRGLAVMRAILSYAGRPVPVLREGEWQRQPGWGLVSRENFVNLGPRWLSLCETPDLDILPERFPQLRSAIFRAGLELPVLHLGLWLASQPVRWRLLPSLLPFARPFLALAGWFERFGGDRGGMVVEALGRDPENRPTRARWSLIAEAGDGPYVPTLPALAAIRRLADPAGRPIPPGAGPCVGLLPLAAIEAEMARHRITTSRTIAHPQPLFQRALGPGFAAMPEPIRALHGSLAVQTFRGEARVERGHGLVVRLVAALFRLPAAIESGPVRVTIQPDGRGGERWRRRFGHRAFSSRLSLAPDGEDRGRLYERFGPFSMALSVAAHDRGLAMAVTGWRLGPIPLPRCLRPTTQASERHDAQDRFLFDVALFLPLAGLLVRYTGWLLPEAGGERCTSRKA